jgi:hypothetical protein
MSEIGKKIRDFGETKFSSINKFASAMEMSAPNLQQYLRGDREPGSPFLIKLKNLGCDMNWLLSEEDESGLIIKEPSMKYKINSLELENEELKEEVVRLKNGIASTIVTLQEHVKPKKKNISDRWKPIK